MPLRWEERRHWRLRPDGGGGDKDRSPKKPNWQIFLESTGGAALITALVAGLAASAVTAIVQRGAKAREFQDSWLKSRGDQALLAYKDYLEQEQQSVKHTYDVIGDSISGADNMLSLSTKAFALGSHQGVEAERTEYLKKWNAADEQWRRENEKIGLLMSYYHRGNAEVISTWDDSSNAVSKYMQCAENWFDAHETKPVTEEKLEAEACVKEKAAYKKSLKEFSAVLNRTRQYAWEGWESPESMKQQLNQ